MKNCRPASRLTAHVGWFALDGSCMVERPLMGVVDALAESPSTS